jgi:hypothetical protein
MDAISSNAALGTSTQAPRLLQATRIGLIQVKSSRSRMVVCPLHTHRARDRIAAAQKFARHAVARRAPLATGAKPNRY